MPELMRFSPLIFFTQGDLLEFSWVKSSTVHSSQFNESGAITTSKTKNYVKGLQKHLKVSKI